MPEDESDPEAFVRAFVRRKLEELPPADMVIFAAGAFLGYHGYTPLTALIGAAKGFTETVQRSQRTFEETIAQMPGPAQAFFGFINLVLPVFGIVAGGLTGPSSQPSSQVQQASARMLNATLGMIEAYALTRPGTVGGILQGIGAIVPL